MNDRPDRDDVARLAGVSSATVSRVFNAPSRVSKDKVKRVLAAAKKLGYAPDKSASALRRGTSGTIVFFEHARRWETLESRHYLYLHGAVLRVVSRTIGQSLYHLELTEYASAKDVRGLVGRNVSGVLGSNPAPDVLSAIAREGIPYVTCNQTEQGLSPYHRVFIDERAGGALAAGMLARAGCQRPAHVAGMRIKSIPSLHRWEGFASACEREPVLIDGDLGVDGGRASGRALAKEVRRGRVDGVFVVNDLTASGVMQVLLSEGIRVPGDVRMVGYDNLPIVDTLPVKLATIDIGFERQAETAARALLAMLQACEAPGSPVRIPIVPRPIHGTSLD